MSNPIPVTATPRSWQPEACMVDMEWLREMAGDEPNGLAELIDLYMAQANQIMSEIRSAIQSGSARDIERLAHKLAGSSSSCGMKGVASVLLRLERLGSDAPAPEREQLFLDARREFELTQRLLATEIPHTQQGA